MNPNHRLIEALADNERLEEELKEWRLIKHRYNVTSEISKKGTVSSSSIAAMSIAILSLLVAVLSTLWGETIIDIAISCTAWLSFSIWAVGHSLINLCSRRKE